MSRPAFDAKTPTSAPQSFTTSTSWTHGPVGTPKAVVVLIAENVGTTDVISGVTYGGVTMTRVPAARATDSTGEPGQSYVYFLGASIPTGNQTVAITVSSGTTAKRAVCITYTGDADCIVLNTATATADGTYSVTIGSLGNSTPLAAAAVTFSGLNSPATLTASDGTNYANDDVTSGGPSDFGSQVCSFQWTKAGSTLAADSSGNLTVAFGGTADDRAMIAIAFATKTQAVSGDALASAATLYEPTVTQPTDPARQVLAIRRRMRMTSTPLMRRR